MYVHKSMCVFVWRGSLLTKIFINLHEFRGALLFATFIDFPVRGRKILIMTAVAAGARNSIFLFKFYLCSGVCGMCLSKSTSITFFI